MKTASFPLFFFQLSKYFQICISYTYLPMEILNFSILCTGIYISKNNEMKLKRHQNLWIDLGTHLAAFNKRHSFWPFILLHTIYHVTLFLQLFRLKLQILAMFSIYLYIFSHYISLPWGSELTNWVLQGKIENTYYIYLFDLGIIIVVWFSRSLNVLWRYSRAKISLSW